MAEEGGDHSLDRAPEPRPSESAPTGDNTEARADQPQPSVEGGEKPKTGRERMNVQTMGVVEGFRSQLKPDGSNAGELLGRISQGELKNLISDPRQLELAQKRLSEELSTAVGIKQGRGQETPASTTSEPPATAPTEPEAPTPQGQVQTPASETQTQTEPEQPTTVGEITEQPPAAQGTQTGQAERFDPQFKPDYNYWIDIANRDPNQALQALEHDALRDIPGENQRIIADKIKRAAERSLSRQRQGEQPVSAEERLAEAVGNVVENGGKLPAAAEPQTPTVPTPPEQPSSGDGDETLRDALGDVTREKVDLSDYEDVTKDEIDEEIGDYASAVRDLRKKNMRLDPNSEQYQRNESAIAAGRAKIKELKYVRDKKFGTEQTVVSGQTEADWQRVERARIESISDYETMPVDELRSTVDTLRRQRNALSRRLGEEIITGNPVRKAAVNAELADVQSRLIEAEKIAKERGPKADQEKYEADRKALEEAAKAKLGEKRTIEDIRNAIVDTDAELATLSADSKRLAQELEDPNLAPDQRGEKQRQHLEVLRRLDETARLQAGNQEALESHPDAIVGKDRQFKFDINEYYRSSEAERGKILTGYGETLDYTAADVTTIENKLKTNQRVGPKELAIYAREMGDLLGKKKEGKPDMKDLQRFCRTYPELQASVFAQVAQSEAVQKAFQEKYPSNWRKMLNFAKNHPGWMWVMLAILAGGVIGTGVAFKGVSGLAGQLS